MISSIKRHPLLTCLILALALRLVAVVFSKGFMASDDYFETVKIAYQGIQHGLTDNQGLMRWDEVQSSNIGRSPLYVIFLFSIMKVQQVLGITDLDSMMYLVRLIHALLSLLIVWFGYKYVLEATRSNKFALLAGLILGGHFLAPYLGVRTLIEQVSSDLFVPAIFLAYKGTRDQNSKYLLWAGILSGLSWMIRFNIAVAIIPIPFAIWYLSRRVTPALYFCAGILLMILFSASLDSIFLGAFGQSSINIIRSFLSPAGPPPLPQPFWFFLVLILAAFIPPFSFYLIYSIFQKAVLKEHLIIISSALSFFVVHSLITHKEERFIIPLFPILVIAGMIGLYNMLEKKALSPGNRRIFAGSAGLAVIVSLVLLPMFTLHFGHKGLIEPFVYLSEKKDVRHILVDCTDRKRLVPFEYAGLPCLPPIMLYDWDSLYATDGPYERLDSVNYLVIFTEDSLAKHTEMLQKRFGKIQPIYRATPSFMDKILHVLNPMHNYTNQAWVCRREAL